MKTPNPTPLATVDAQNPWLGLVSYTEVNRAYFHGRDEEARELVRRLERKTLTILFGQSGLGKSSLLQAGVFPRLRATGFVPVYLRLDHGPEAPPLAEQIKPAVLAETTMMGKWSHPGSAAAGESLWEYFHHRDDVLHGGSGQKLIPVLVFDQFEELFTLGAADDATRARALAFIAELADLVENRAPASFEARADAGAVNAEAFDFARSDYRVLITLREDYLPHLESLKAAMPALMQNRMRLTRLSGAQALEAVVKPSPGLVPDDVAQAIVTFVSGRSDAAQAEVEPSLLSLVCRELNYRRLAAGAARIDAALLAGSRETILTEFYERTMADQSPAVRHWVENDLLTDSGYRENIALERARKSLVAAGADPAAIDVLVSRRLLRIEERLDVRRIELTHDVLCAVVRASRDARREREAAELAERRRRETETALTEARRREAVAQRSAVRARLIAMGCAGLALVAIASAVFGFVGLHRARVAEQEALRTRQLAETARAQAEGLVSYLISDVEPLLEQYGRVAQLKQLADRAAGYFAALPPELRDLDTDRHEARAMLVMAWVQDALGKKKEVEASLNRASALLQRVLAAAPDDYVSRAYSISFKGWTDYLADRGTMAEKKEGWSNSLAQMTAIAQAHPENIEMSRLLAQGRQRHGAFLRNDAKEYAASLEEAKKLQVLWQEIMAREPENKFNRLWYAGSLLGQSSIYTQMHEAGKAVQKSREGLDYLEQCLQQDPGNLSLLEAAQRNAQFLAYAAGATSISLTEMRQAELLARRYAQTLLQIDPANLYYQGELADAHKMEGNFYRADGQWPAAREISRKYRELMSGVSPAIYGTAQNAYRWLQMPILEAYLDEGTAAAAMGDTAAAAALLDKAHVGFGRLNPDKSPDAADFRKQYVPWMLGEAKLVGQMGDWSALEHRSTELLEVIGKGLAAAPGDAELRLRRASAGRQLGLAQLRQGKTAQAGATLRQADEDYRRTPDLPAEVDYNRAVDALGTRELLAEALLDNGEGGEARGILEAMLPVREKELAQQPQIWSFQRDVARTATLLAATLNEANPADQQRRSELLARAEAILTAPGANQRLVAEDRLLLARLETLKKTGP